MWKWIWSAALTCSVLLVVAPSRSDVASADGALTQGAADPALDGPIAPLPPNATRPRDPFTPWDTGPAVWTYEDLTVAEQDVADAAEGGTDWNKTNNAFAAAAAEQGQKARAVAEAHQLGIDDLAGTGVVP